MNKNDTHSSVLTHLKTAIPLLHRIAQQHHWNTAHQSQHITRNHIRWGISVILTYKTTHRFFGQQMFPPADAMCRHSSVLPFICRSKSCREDIILHIHKYHAKLNSLFLPLYTYCKEGSVKMMWPLKKNRKHFRKYCRIIIAMHRDNGV